MENVGKIKEIVKLDTELVKIIRLVADDDLTTDAGLEAFHYRLEKEAIWVYHTTDDNGDDWYQFLIFGQLSSKYNKDHLSIVDEYLKELKARIERNERGV